MNANDIKNACRINTRITNLGNEISKLLDYLDPEFDSGDIIVNWVGYEDNDFIELTVSYAEMRNDSCHCHPEYHLDSQTRTYSLSYLDLLNDDYYTEDGELHAIPGSMIKDKWGQIWYRYTHPLWLKIEERLTEAKMEREDRENAKKRAEEDARRRQDEQRERNELARLQSKYTK